MLANASWIESLSVIGLGVGCALALVSAITLSLSRSRAMQRLGNLAGSFCGTALLVLGLGLWFAAWSGPAGWNGFVRPETMTWGIVSFLLLISLVHRPARSPHAGSWPDLALAWLAVAAGVWNLIIMMTRM